MVKHILTTTLLLLISCTHAFAVPASPDPVEVIQPDGSIVMTRIQGDELQNWTVSEDTGHTILHNRSSGYWEYAEQAKDGTLRPSGFHVLPNGRSVPSGLSKGLKPHRNRDNEQHMLHMLREEQQQPAENLSSPATSAASATVDAAAAVWNPTPVAGSKKLLVILVSFADRSFSTSPAGWYSKIFDESDKSVAKFYLDNSLGAMRVAPVTHSQAGSPAGIVSVTLSTNHPNTGGSYTFASDQAWGNSALALASSYVNFKSLDSNGNGKLETSEVVIYFVAAGYETSGSSKTPSVWAHAWSTTGTGLTVGGKNIQRWAQNGELNNSSVQHPMGVIAHELGHQMCGLPDLYDISQFNAGLGNFSLMAGGSWGRDYTESYGGTTPTSLDAWSREFLGWSTPITPDMSNPVSPFSFDYQLSSPATPYKLILPSTSTSEYFLLENRWPSGWDLGLRGMPNFGSGWQGGVLVLHIDNNAGSAINDYTNNTGHRQGVVPVQASTATCNMLASGTASSCRGNSKTLFYSANNTLWTPASSPNSNYYSGSSTNLYLNAISLPGNSMTAEFSFGAPTPPDAPTMGFAIRGNGQAAVSFTAPMYDGGSAITSYTVTSSPGGKIASGATSPLTVSGLSNGTAYTFAVTASNANGTGPASSVSNSVTPATTPGTPTNATAVRGNAQATVSFTAPASDGGSAITNYTVTSSPGGYIGMGASSPVTVTGLTNGTAYTFRVTAANSVGTGSPSSASNSVTPATVPDAPVIETATVGSGQVTVSFSAPASDGGSALTGYTVRSSGGQWATGASSPIAVTGLTNGTAYTFTVLAGNGVGNGASSSPSEVVTPGVVRNGAHTSSGYQTLQTAYSADTLASEIQVVAGATVGPFVKDDGATVTVSGGFDASFSTNNGAPAILGAVTLKNGAMIFENIIIGSP
ncbi:MAG: M6 family metalloprotease domain-containing protein [Desulfuromonadales bacterium]|nr:M6 family metalloprotease domain-containing protein [Desulfuromonadales bacterium]